MHFENKLKWHRSFLNLLEEEDLLQCDCISVTDGENSEEQQIYLAKIQNEFEVRIYKANTGDTYTPSTLDFNLKRYESNDEFASFFFNSFFFARRFIWILREYHPEYNLRP